MKKKKIFVSILILGTITSFWYMNQSRGYVHRMRDDRQCSTDTECTLSRNHPEGPARCVNREWQREWDSLEASEKFVWQCGTANCMNGSCEDIPAGEYCSCDNSRCQRADISEYGWEWACS